MPSKSPRVCNKPGCGVPTMGGYCERHKGEVLRYERERASAAKRGYGRRWRRYAKWFLAQPENRICKCGCGRLSSEVDHIEPVNGPDDPMFWEPTNHQGLTHECHSRKTMKELRRGQGGQNVR